MKTKKMISTFCLGLMVIGCNSRIHEKEKGYIMYDPFENETWGEIEGNTGIFEGTYSVLKKTAGGGILGFYNNKNLQGKTPNRVYCPPWTPWASFKRPIFGLKSGERYLVFLGDYTDSFFHQEKNQILKILPLHLEPQEIEVLKTLNPDEEVRCSIGDLLLNEKYPMSQVRCARSKIWLDKLCIEFRKKIQSKKLTLENVACELGLPDEIIISDVGLRQGEVFVVYYLSSFEMTEIHKIGTVMKRSCPKLIFKANGPKVLILKIEKYSEDIPSCVSRKVECDRKVPLRRIEI